MPDATAGARGAILGTAGHIDHGKTALVRALTGTDTDRLAEEKARGITIELGFAELVTDGGHRFGVVDVPGHEAFVRAMVAGAAGMDVVLLVVAADEGVMPQTREHLAIVELLGVPELVVALTKCDLVEPEWLELVDADVADTLSSTPYADAPRIPTSSEDGRGLDVVVQALDGATERVAARASDDLARLPLDRVFTIQGTGTVVTGTLWSGTLTVGDRIRVLPEDLPGRVRSVQVHGRRVEVASAGDRTAVALTGEGSDRDLVRRGATVVTAAEWRPSRMLTVRARILDDVSWSIEHNQRVHVHLGTAEVLARCAVLEDRAIGPGTEGWIQLRLEEPVVARGRDRVVIRAYSPVTTIGGGVVAETRPPKRNRLDAALRGRLERMVHGGPAEAVAAHLETAGWSGLERSLLPIETGLRPSEAESALAASDPVVTARRVFAGSVRAEAELRILEAVRRGHAEDPLRPGVPLAGPRAALPRWAPPGLAEAVIESLVAEGRLEVVEGDVRLPGHEPTLRPDQEAALAELRTILVEGGLAPPPVDELPAHLREREDFRSLVRRLEDEGVVRHVGEGLYISENELDGAMRRVRDLLGGRRNLGPADFREALPVTRKHLIPLLNFLDGQGTTVRDDDGREVPLGR